MPFYCGVHLQIQAHYQVAEINNKFHESKMIQPFQCSTVKAKLKMVITKSKARARFTVSFSKNISEHDCSGPSWMYPGLESKEG